MLDPVQIADQEYTFGLLCADRFFFTYNKLFLMFDGLVLEGNPNERYWSIHKDELILHDLHNRPTTRMRPTPWGFAGPYLKDPKFTHFLCRYKQPANIRYLISTCPHFMDRTLPVLLPKLYKSGVREEEINVVVANASKARLEIVDDIPYEYVTPNVWELTALIAMSRRNDFDPDTYWFLLSDTLEPGPNFGKLSRQANIGMDPDVHPSTITWRKSANVYHSNNHLGLYKHSFLTRSRPFMEKWIGIPKEHGVDIELDRHGRGPYNFAGNVASYWPNAYTNGGEVDWMGAKRHDRYFQNVDIHKYWMRTCNRQPGAGMYSIDGKS